MTTSRRAVIGAAAALAGGTAINAVAIVSAKSACVLPGQEGPGEIYQNDKYPDPIFALIERHRAMRAEIAATDHDGPDGEDRLTAAVALLDAAEEAILSAPLVSLAGAAAALRYLNNLDGGIFIEVSSDAFLERLADAIERIAVPS